MTSAASIQMPRPLDAVTVVRTLAPDEPDPSPPSPPIIMPSREANEHQAAQERMAQAQRELEMQRQALAQAAAALRHAGEDLAAFRERFAREAEQQLLDLSFQIAQKVLMQEIRTGRYEIDPIVKEALQHISSRQNIVIRLHPDDLAASKMAQEAEGQGGLRFVADSLIARAQCVLETPEGVIESSIDGHLEGVAEALKTSEGIA